MQGQLYQVSYLGATYYAVPVYYPGSVIFQSWYLIAYVNGMLVPYTIVPGNTVVVLYNPYLGTPGTPTPPATPGTPTAGVLTLNGLTGTLTIAASGGIVVSQSGSTISLVGSGGTNTGLTQAQADALYAPLPTGAPAPGVPAPSPGDPLPQYVLGTEILGSTYKEQATAPTSPVVGQLWKNTSTLTVAGIPTQNYGIWNGTEWVNLGVQPYPTSLDIFGSTYKEQPTAPTSPITGQIWQNTSGSTVAGVPPGQYAVWNGTAWVPSGTTSPFLTPDKAVTSVNTLKGDVAIVAGSNVVLTPSGQNLLITVTAGVSSLIAPISPYAGQVWYNAASSTVSGVPSGSFGVWSGTAWVSTGSAQPGGQVLPQTTAPLNPSPGQTWYNISGGTLAGIPSGNHGVWTGAAWISVGAAIPSTVTSGSALSGFSASNSSNIAVPVGSQKLIFNTKNFDTFAAYNVTSGEYTIPASQVGIWQWRVGCSIPWVVNAYGVDVYVTKNTPTGFSYADGIAVGQYYICLGEKPIFCIAGDVLRWIINSPFGALDLYPGGLIYADRVGRIS